jgi:hypothetical protein
MAYFMPVRLDVKHFVGFAAVVGTCHLVSSDRDHSHQHFPGFDHSSAEASLAVGDHSRSVVD